MIQVEIEEDRWMSVSRASVICREGFGFRFNENDIVKLLGTEQVRPMEGRHGDPNAKEVRFGDFLAAVRSWGKPRSEGGDRVKRLEDRVRALEAQRVIDIKNLEDRIKKLDDAFLFLKG